MFRRAAVESPAVCPEPFDQSLKYRQLIPVLLLLLLLGRPAPISYIFVLGAFSRLSCCIRHWPADYIIHERVANIMRAKRTDNISTAAGHSRVFHNDKPDLLFFSGGFSFCFFAFKKYFFKGKRRRRKKREREVWSDVDMSELKKRKKKKKRDKPVIFVTCP